MKLPYFKHRFRRGLSGSVYSLADHLLERVPGSWRDPGLKQAEPRNLPLIARQGAAVTRRYVSSFAVAMAGCFLAGSVAFFGMVAVRANAAAEVEVPRDGSPNRENAPQRVRWPAEFSLIDRQCANGEFGNALRSVLELGCRFPERRPELLTKSSEVLRWWRESQQQPCPADISILEILAGAGNPDARMLMLRSTQGLSRLPHQVRLAALEGHLPSMIEMGKLEEARGNAKEAVGWYLQAANLGSVEGMVRFGECRLFGRGIDAAPVEAVRYLDGAAANGDARAMDLLGVCYDRGLAVPADEVLAFEWFESAVAAGSVRACYHLGKRYAEGRGVAKDLSRSTGLFRSGAESGDAESMAAYARCLEMGIGVKRDHGQAKSWYQRAAAKGNGEGEAWCRANGITAQVSAETP